MSRPIEISKGSVTLSKRKARRSRAQKTVSILDQVTGGLGCDRGMGVDRKPFDEAAARARFEAMPLAELEAFESKYVLHVDADEVVNGACQTLTCNELAKRHVAVQVLAERAELLEQDEARARVDAESERRLAASEPVQTQRENRCPNCGTDLTGAIDHE